MAQINKKPNRIYTHEGGVAKRIDYEMELRRSVMACLLWENTFYESGVDIVERIKDLCQGVDNDKIASMAIDAREKQKLRHVPLFLCRELARKGYGELKDVLSVVIQRADELTEFLSIYWKDGKRPLSAQIKKGLSMAFNKFDEYQFAKYNRKTNIKLRDVMFLCHAKPKDCKQAELFKKIANNELATPDTWEVNLSTGKDKKETFMRLIIENKLGGLAFLRNLRNMLDSGVPVDFIRDHMQKVNAKRILPFRFISASKHAPMLEPDLEKLMLKSFDDIDKTGGKTVLLIDVSGSMDWSISDKTDVSRIDCASGLAIYAREVFEDIRVYTFSNALVEVPLRRGFALRDAIWQSQGHQSTYLKNAIESLPHFDRFICITDEQSHDGIAKPKADKSYLINVASCKNGVGYYDFVHIDGWSENIIRYIQEYEKSESCL